MFSITSFGTLSGLLIGLTRTIQRGSPSCDGGFVLECEVRCFTSDYGDHAIDKLNPCGY